MQFFREKEGSIKATMNIPPSDFRKPQYELIIDDYLEKKNVAGFPSQNSTAQASAKAIELHSTEKVPVSGDNEETSKEKTAKENPSLSKSTHKEKTLHCIKDWSVLRKKEVRKVTVIKTGKKISFPIYECPSCKGKYTSLRDYRDLQPITFSGDKYTNITEEKENERYIKYLQKPHFIIPGTKCYAYGAKRSTICRVCGCKDLLNASIIMTAKKKKKEFPTYQVKFCKSCKTYYVPYNLFINHKNDWSLLNENEIPEIKEGLRIKAEEKAKRKTERKAAKEAKALKKEEQLKRQQAEKEKLEKEQILKRQLAEQERQKELLKREQKLLRQQEENKKLERERLLKRLQAEKERLERERIARENEYRQSLEQLLRQEQRKSNQAESSQEHSRFYEHDNNIRVKDFVVRRTTFKCRHNEHKLQNIDAVISIIDKKGDVKQATVPAGYCPNCNVFFIMESTYQSLKNKGTPICRVSNEKAYLSNSSFANGMQLAQESVLMQYGYSVSQEEGLTAARRRKILALMIDNKILTRSDIISYLDFFINQRKYQHRFEKAIAKWESDREFVSEYKSGSYSKYGVSGIYRKY